jgi:hypothetical protein
MSPFSPRKSCRTLAGPCAKSLWQGPVASSGVEAARLRWAEGPAVRPALGNALVVTRKSNVGPIHLVWMVDKIGG